MPKLYYLWQNDCKHFLIVSQKNKLFLRSLNLEKSRRILPQLGNSCLFSCFVKNVSKLRKFMTENTKKYLLFSGIGIIVLLLAMWVLDKDGPNPFSTETKEEYAERMSRSSDPTSGDGSGNGEDGSDGSNFDASEDGVSAGVLLETYKEWAQYPPYSRPMSILNHDLAFPFIVENSPSYLFDTPESKEPNGYVCLFQPRAWAVIGTDDKMHVTLECRDSDRKRVKLSIDKHQVFREFEGKRFGAVSADVNDNGQNGDESAGDGIFTFEWKPLKGDWGDMSLVADITYGPGKKTQVTASFFSSPSVAARFTGNFTEQVDEGSLVVKAVLNVFTKGKYHLEANIKDKRNGEYIAYATFDGTLNSGTQEVKFIFFGKILRDKGLDGPYIATDFRGHRVNLPIDPDWFSQGAEGLKKIQAARTTEPDRELVFPFKEGYETRKYEVETFSKNAWSAQEKTDRIKQLEILASQEK